MGEATVPELLQEHVTGENIARRLHDLLHQPAERERLQAVYAAIRARLGESGASARAAQVVWQRLTVPNPQTASPLHLMPRLDTQKT
jgi:lipid-A-disaccharide synthase